MTRADTIKCLSALLPFIAVYLLGMAIGWVIDLPTVSSWLFPYPY